MATWNVESVECEIDRDESALTVNNGTGIGGDNVDCYHILLDWSDEDSYHQIKLTTIQAKKLIGLLQRAVSSAEELDAAFRKIKEESDGIKCHWTPLDGEIITYDGTPDCDAELHLRDLFIYVENDEARLYEACSLTGYIDYGPIHVGDRVLLTRPDNYVYILPKGASQ